MKRRSFVQSLALGLGSLGLASSSLGSGPLGRSRARADGAPPTRFVVFHTPSDALGPSFYAPPGTGDRAITTLPAPMEALQPFRDRLLMFGQLRYPHVAQNHTAIGRVLTCSTTGGTWGNDESAPLGLWPTGPSLDHVIGAHLGTSPLVLGVRTASRDPVNRLSFRAGGDPVEPFDDPSAAFATAFGPALADAAEAEVVRARLRRRASVLDASLAELGALRPRLGATDARKIDAHLTALRAIEARVARDAAGLYACSPDPLAIDGGFDHRAPLWVTRTAELSMDVLAQALACSVTRVATLQIGTAGDTFGHRPGEGFATQVIAPELGIDLGEGLDEHNHIIHEFATDSVGEVRDRRLQLERIYYSLFARLLARLDGIAEGDGTLLDHTVVVWVKSLGQGISHRADDMLFMVAGGGALGVRGGRYLDRTGQPINALYAGVANLFGMGLSTFGDPSWGGVGSCCSDPSWLSMAPMSLT